MTVKRAVVATITTSNGTFTSDDLAELLSTQIFDAEDAAQFLGLARNSIEYAAYRKRIPFVQYGAKKLFTRADLIGYRDHRGRGRESKLTDAKSVTVKKPTEGATPTAR